MSLVRRQVGSVLVMSTLILAALAGLSLGTLQKVVSEHQLTGQAQDKAVALSSAQYAVAEAKRLLLTKWSTGAPTCPSVSGCSGSNGVLVWSESAFRGLTDLTTQPATFFDSAQAATSPNPKVAAAPRFFIIDLGCDRISNSERYRIVAKGFGASLNTVGYADSSFNIPLSSQNSAVGAPTTPMTGLAIASDMVTLNPVTYNLAKSTNSSVLFFNTPGGACGTQQSSNTGASCEMNCAGDVRVKGYSFYNNNSNCGWIYGDWVSGANQSQMTLKEASGVLATVQCGPCQTSLSVPTSICGSGFYNSCTKSCAPLTCPAGQYKWGNYCVTCPAGRYSSAGASFCTLCPADTYSAAGASSCTACATDFHSLPGSKSCTYCPESQGAVWITTVSVMDQKVYAYCDCINSRQQWSGSACVCSNSYYWNSSRQCCEECHSECSRRILGKCVQHKKKCSCY